MKEGGNVTELISMERARQVCFVFTGKGPACFWNAKVADVTTVRDT